MDSIYNNVCWGGYYRVKHHNWSNTQSYGTAVPILDSKSQIWMQDTYQLRRPNGVGRKDQTNNAIHRIIHEFPLGTCDYTLARVRSDYYYHNQEIIYSESMLFDRYELICDLNDYEYCDVDYRYFDADDIIPGVRLYFEHGYDWNRGPVGVTLVKLFSSPKLLNEFDASISDTFASLRYPSGGYGYTTLETLYKKLQDTNIQIPDDISTRYKRLLELKKLLNRQKLEIEQLYMKWEDKE